MVTTPLTTPPTLPESRPLEVRSSDGTRLHAEVFGPQDGYPIVLSHGITCALRVWHEQINDLSADYRVIAFDHRGHGRSAVPRRGNYSLGHLAADLDAVLTAALADGERAVIAGHSMGGITIAAWADHYRDHVTKRADAVAMINTTVGDILTQVKFLPVPERHAARRVRVAGRVLKTFGGVPALRVAEKPSRRFVQQLAVGRDADPAVADLVYELFASTPRVGRGGCARMIVDAMGPGQDIDVTGLTVPTLVIGSTRDRLLPITQSRRIAEAVPNLVELVELAGGHCAILERPREVNARLRALVESAVAGQSS
ncbi:MAG: alpha/beta fold hydrolase [Mycobacterium sp.]